MCDPLDCAVQTTQLDWMDKQSQSLFWYLSFGYKPVILKYEMPSAEPEFTSTTLEISALLCGYFFPQLHL